MTTETTPGHPEDGNVPAVTTMPRIMEDVDDVLLTEAMRLLEAGSAIATINQALAELITERRRRRAADSQLRRFEAGQFTGLPRTGGER